MTDEEIFTQVATEIKRREIDHGLWTRAFAQSGGDEKKALSIYIQLRFAAIKGELIRPDVKVSDRRYSFEISGGPLRLIKRRLEIEANRVTFGDKMMTCESVEWIKIGALTQIVNFVKTGSSYNIEMSDGRTTISIQISDVMYGKSGKRLFEEIHDAVMDCVGIKVLNKLLQRLSSGGTFEIGPMRFSRQGVTMPRHGFIFNDGEALVPWSSIVFSYGNGSVSFSSGSEKKLYGSCELRSTRNGYLLAPLYNFLVKDGNYRKL